MPSSMVVVQSDDAVEILKAIGYKTAHKWDDDKLLDSVKALDEVVTDDVREELESKDLEQLDVVDQILAAIESGAEITLGNDTPTPKKKKKKKEAPVVEEDELPDDDFDDDEDEEDEDFDEEDELPDEEEDEDEAESEPVVEEAPPKKKRRGRPPGKKNKAKKEAPKEIPATSGEAAEIEAEEEAAAEAAPKKKKRGRPAKKKEEAKTEPKADSPITASEPKKPFPKVRGVIVPPNPQPVSYVCIRPCSNGFIVSSQRKDDSDADVDETYFGTLFSATQRAGDLLCGSPTVTETDGES